MKLLIFLILISIIKQINCAPSFTLKFRYYDFKPEQPGFNISYDQYIKNQIVPDTAKDNLNEITRKPEYCCGNSRAGYIENQKVFDDSFKETPNSKIGNVEVGFYKFQSTSAKSPNYNADLKNYFPLDGKGWNEGVQGRNLFFCLEGHFEFQFKKTDYEYFSIQSGGQSIVFINNKKVIESSDRLGKTKNPKSPSVDVNSLGLELNKKYPVDIFHCNRFDLYSPQYFYINSPFVLNCVNYEGVNDDTCPFVRPKCVSNKDCDDGNGCTEDICPDESVVIPRNENYSKYCTHKPITCPTTDKCTQSLGCNKDSGKCETTPVVCPKSDQKCITNTCDINKGCQVFKNSTLCDDNDRCTIDMCTDKGCVFTRIPCNDGIDCTADSCSFDKGCVYTPNDSKCDDKNPCTIDKCDTKLGCTHTPVECNIDPNNKCIVKNTCNIKTGQCETEQTKCPTNKVVGALGLGVLCQKQKCNPVDGKCIADGVPSLLC